MKVCVNHSFDSSFEKRVPLLLEPHRRFEHTGRREYIYPVSLEKGERSSAGEEICSQG